MTLKAKILYLTYDGLTDALGRSQILPYLLGLSEEFDITIVSFEKPHLFKDNSKEIFQSLANKIYWIPQVYTKNPPVLSTIFDILVLRGVCKKLVSGSTYQIVHCRSYITSLIGVWLKRKYGIKFIFDMRGFWVDERVEGGLWRLSNPVYRQIYKYFKRREIRFLQEADCIIVLTNKANTIITSILKPTLQRLPSIVVIPCCVEVNLFDPSKIDEQRKDYFRNRLKIKDDAFVLLYLGSIGTWYMLNEMLDFFKVLVEKNPKSVFLFVTADSENTIIKIANEKKINIDKIIVTKASRDEVPLYISLSNVSIFFIKPMFSKQASSPTKLGETLAMGIPSVTNCGIGDIDNLFRQTKMGYLTESFTVEQYLKVIDTLVGHDTYNKEVIRSTALEFFSLKVGLERYAAVYNHLHKKFVTNELQ